MSSIPDRDLNDSGMGEDLSAHNEGKKNNHVCTSSMDNLTALQAQFSERPMAMRYFGNIGFEFRLRQPESDFTY